MKGGRLKSWSPFLGYSIIWGHVLVTSTQIVE